MYSIHQAKLKSDHLLHKMALVQSQRNSTVNRRLKVLFFSLVASGDILHTIHLKVKKPKN